MESPNYLEEVMDLQPGAMIAYSPQFDVSWRNRTAEHYAPGAAPGKNLYDALVPFANEEKIDRLLLKSEKVMFSPGPQHPILEWVVHDETVSNGDRLIMAWDPAITDQMLQRRATFSMAAATPRMYSSVRYS